MRVLVVVDMQNDFITGALGNRECEEAVPFVVKAIEGDYDKIFVTQDTHHEDYLDTAEGKRLPVVHCVENTEGWELNFEISEALKGRDAVYVHKPSFGSVALGEYIHELSLENEALTIDFCGVCTGICVLSNAIIAKAQAPEADVRVIEKACACVTPDSHRTAIEAMKLCQIEII